MKRFLLSFVAAAGLFVASFVPSMVVPSLAPAVQAAPSATTMNVYCKDGTNGTTNDAAAFCKGHGGPYNVSNGTYPFKCANGTVGTGPDAQTACATKGGAAVTNSANTPNCIKLSIPIFAGQDCIDNTQPGGAILVYVKQILKLLSLAIGAVILLMLIVSGIQYVTSTGQPDMIKAAKNRIINAITALVLFMMAYAILNFLIPGGIFS